MRALLPICSLLTVGAAGLAHANPCGAAPKSEAQTVASWQAVYTLLVGPRGSPYKDDADASASICASKACGPGEPISVVGEMMGLGAAVVLKDASGYVVIPLPVDLPPHVFEADFSRLRPDTIHVSVDYEELGREMFCEDADRDKDGDCIDGTSATVILGYNDHDFLIDPIKRALVWSKACSIGEDVPYRDSRVRLDGDNFGYESCKAGERTAWFTLKGGACAPSAPFDIAGMQKRARALAKGGDYAGAIGLFDTLVKAEPTDASILGERGFLKHKAGDQAGAMADLDAALALSPGSNVAGVLQFNRGLVLLERGDAKRALEAFHAANNLRPSSAAKAKIAAAEALLKK